MRDHGGNLDWAMARYGGVPEDWLDLSTGINPEPYPVPALPRRAWAVLPTKADIARLTGAARDAYATEAGILPVAGAQAAIQMVPQLGGPGRARILGPTYNEHAAAFRAAGWRVEIVGAARELTGADAAVVVNPNNPDGRVIEPDALLALAAEVGMLIVDESFADPVPEISIASRASGNLLALRSFGKFYGLAGLRLGFVLGAEEIIARLSEMAGPWPVSGAAIEIGCAALADRLWQQSTTRRIAADAARLDALAMRAGWKVAGGTTLFRLYETSDAPQAQDRLARGRVWSRVFPYSRTWLRLGLPDTGGWAQLEAALLRP